jgi:hypothetical protein
VLYVDEYGQVAPKAATPAPPPTLSAGETTYINRVIEEGIPYIVAITEAYQQLASNYTPPQPPGQMPASYYGAVSSGAVPSGASVVGIVGPPVKAKVTPSIRNPETVRHTLAVREGRVRALQGHSLFGDVRSEVEHGAHKVAKAHVQAAHTIRKQVGIAGHDIRQVPGATEETIRRGVADPWKDILTAGHVKKKTTKNPTQPTPAPTAPPQDLDTDALVPYGVTVPSGYLGQT